MLSSSGENTTNNVYLVIKFTESLSFQAALYQKLISLKEKTPTLDERTLSVEPLGGVYVIPSSGEYVQAVILTHPV